MAASIRAGQAGGANPFRFPVPVSGHHRLFDGIAHATPAGTTILELEMTGEARIHIRSLSTARGLETQLRNVIANLIRNALVHALEGHQILNIEIGAGRDADREIVYVRDDGKGIPTGQRDRIFDYFFRGAVDSLGSGIGLAFCSQALERMAENLGEGGIAPRHRPLLHGENALEDSPPLAVPGQSRSLSLRHPCSRNPVC
ncbi:MAG: HAMP domain-containing histidine kinase [Verrucomicrobiaceae bacterium]|nr:MAG: HAMP domain-containing histidine kinase [Verrucomicrobiaceae bacterium]